MLFVCLVPLVLMIVTMMMSDNPLCSVMLTSLFYHNL